MGRVTRRPRARDDLIEIWTTIATDDERAADRVLARIEKTVAMLSDRPLAGRERPELAEDLRSFVAGNHVVFYRPVPGGIDIVRVRSRYRDLDPARFRG